MSYKLIEMDPMPGGNGLPEGERELAIAEDEQALHQHCLTQLKSAVGKPDKFSWSKYYIIRSSETAILT